MLRVYGNLVRYTGNRLLYRAVEMSILATARGVPVHIHAQGMRGTGKTTVMRAARDIMPLIQRIRGCPYNCSPGEPHCPAHRDLGPEEIGSLGRESIPMPFVEVSASAKLGTMVGSIDLARALNHECPEAALLPGTIARAHRGIVFIDEINRLADVSPELADALLDVMGTKPGRLQIEETGLPPVGLTVSVSVWAASNPDEDPGPLAEVRRQLADRFDLSVQVSRPTAGPEVETVLAHDPFAAAPDCCEAAAFSLPKVRDGRVPAMPADLRTLVAQAYVAFGMESLRAAEAWQLAARLHALIDGKETVTQDDLLATVFLALSHRLDPRQMGEVASFLKAAGANLGTAAVTVASTASSTSGAAPTPPWWQRWRERFRLDPGGLAEQPAPPRRARSLPLLDDKDLLRSGDEGGWLF